MCSFDFIDRDFCIIVKHFNPFQPENILQNKYASDKGIMLAWWPTQGIMDFFKFHVEY